MSLITKKRILSLNPYINSLKEGDLVYAVVSTSNLSLKNAIDFGFSSKLEHGESVLPNILGPTTKFNADGKFIPIRNEPMETVYRQIEWTWKQYNGKDSWKEITEIRDVPYERYHRDFVPPPSVEYRIVADTNTNKLIISPSFILSGDNHKNIIHATNVLLECFGSCELLDENLNPLMPATNKKQTWEILPAGKTPWVNLKPQLLKTIRGAPKGNQGVIEKRFETINNYEPEFTAVGRAGFTGYVVFGFPEKNLFILESTQTNNATYVFEDNWEKLSSYTKAQILNENLCLDRIIHRQTWFSKISNLLHSKSS